MDLGAEARPGARDQRTRSTSRHEPAVSATMRPVESAVNPMRPRPSAQRAHLHLPVVPHADRPVAPSPGPRSPARWARRRGRCGSSRWRGTSPRTAAFAPSPPASAWVRSPDGGPERTRSSTARFTSNRRFRPSRWWTTKNPTPSSGSSVRPALRSPPPHAAGLTSPGWAPSPVGAVSAARGPATTFRALSHAAISSAFPPNR